MKHLIACLFLIVTAVAAQARDASEMTLGNDVFIAGETVETNAETPGDIFVAGNRVDVTAPVEGSAHMAGRRVNLRAIVGGNVYAAGQTVRIAAPVVGNATVAGYDVEIDGPVEGNLRAAGSEVIVNAAVGGTALIGAEIVEIDAAIAGDVRIAAEEIDFSETASIGGTLVLFSDTLDASDIPERVIAPGRITVESPEDWAGAMRENMDKRRDGGSVFGSLLLWVILVAIVSAALSAVFPEALTVMREQILAKPWKALGFGSLAMSAVLGAGILLALTGIGLLLAPAALAATLLLWFAGYVIGAYAAGVGILLAMGRHAPADMKERAIAGGAGAFVVGLLALIPLLGWLLAMAVMLAGAGALTLRILRPAFFTGPEQANGM